MRARWLIPAMAMWALAAAIAPATIVGRYLPAEYDQYRLNLVQGFWLLKCMLIADGLMCLALPFALRLFSPTHSRADDALPTTAKHGPFRSVDRLLVAAMTVFALAVRLYHIGAGFGYDEIFVTTSMYQRTFAGLIARAETHRLFYGLWAWMTSHLAGPSETAARTPALLFGVASVPLLFLCVRSLVGRREGLVAALLLSLSTLHVWYSQEATSYTMALFFAIVSTIGFYRCLSTTEFRPWFVWTLLAFLTTFSHFFVGLLLLLGQAVFGVWLLARGAVNARVAARFVVAATYAMAAFVTVTSITFFTYLDALLEAGALESRGPLEANFVFLGGWIAGAYSAQPWQILFGVATICGTVILARRDPRLTLYLWLPTLAELVLFVSGVMGFITPRYCILALIPATVCVATAIVTVVDAAAATARGPVNGVVRAMAYTLALAPLAYGAGESLSNYFARERYPFHPVAVYLAANAAPQEVLLFGGYGYDKFRHYAPTLKWSREYDGLRTALDAGDSFWLVYYMPEYFVKMPPELRARLEQRGHKPVLYYEGFPDQLVTQFEGIVWHVGQPSSEPRTTDAAREEARSGKAHP
jgi:Dolichyl-phosphate-mannose-protein mannosyltransferase